ncbi:type II secretion system inner membrane protein GspF [Sphingomonas aestuarii]
MAEYRYLAIDAAGREKRGSVSAADDAAARAALMRKRLYVVSVAQGAGVAEPPRESGASLLSQLRLRREKLSQRERTVFTRQLATLVSVSPLEEALRTIARQTESARAAAVVTRVHAGVVEGARLASALSREGKSFSPLYRAMVAGGEASGALPEILERMAALEERQAELRGKLTGTLAYPVILAIVALGVVAALMILVVPKVVSQFDDVGQQLPLVTRIVIGLSDVLASWWWAIGIALALGLLGFARALAQPAFRLRFDGWLLRLPFLGRLIRDLHAARMARTLATMVASRLPILEGLALTVPTIRNHALRAATEAIVAEVRGGGSLSAAMRRAAIFPPLLVYLVASGESAGRLDQMLERAAATLEREFDAVTSALMSLVEPGIIVLMGGVVAVIVLAILLPILELQNLASV